MRDLFMSSALRDRSNGSDTDGDHHNHDDDGAANAAGDSDGRRSSYYGSINSQSNNNHNHVDGVGGGLENDVILEDEPLLKSSYPPNSRATSTTKSSLPLLPSSSTPSSSSTAAGSLNAYSSCSCSSYISQIWNFVVFGWFTPVVDSIQQQLDLGNAPDLDDGDGMIPPLPYEDSTKPISALFEQIWNEEQQRIDDERRRSLWQSQQSSSHRPFTTLFGDSDHGLNSGSSGREGGGTASGGSSGGGSSSSSSSNSTLSSHPTSPNLAYCLWRAFSPTFIQAGFLKLIHDCLQFVGPQVLNGLIQFLRTPTESLSTGIYLTLAVSVAQLLMSLTLRHYFFTCYRVGIRVRTALLMAIYKKSLSIDSSYYNHHPIGQITNLMSVDVQRLQDAITFLHAIWYSFLQIGLALYFLWQQLGPSCLAGVAVILCSIPITAIMASWMGSLGQQVMQKKDDRVQVNQEILSNMKVVKIQAWESSFRDKVTHLRRVELRQLWKYMLGQACVWLTWSAIPLLIALSTFAAYVTIAGQVLDVASALTALALFEILRFPLFMLPMVINNIVEGKVSLKRIEDFLSAPDRVAPRKLKATSPKMVDMYNATFSYDFIHSSTPKPVSKVPSARLTSGARPSIALEINAAQSAAGADRIASETASVMSDEESSTAAATSAAPPFLSRASQSGEVLKSQPQQQQSRYQNVSATWGLSSSPHDNFLTEHSTALKRVNFTCNEGEFIAVVGSVGSGKSTLLKAILGEVQRLSGDVAVRGKVAYFDQKPFIMNETVKQNILFAHSDADEGDNNGGRYSNDGYNDELYKLAIKSCSLQHDLDMLQHGDRTEIGERGITLSGGQKARVSMARVVYQNADIALLDDCLSAVDAHVGRALFDECIVKVLLQNCHSDVASGDDGDHKRKRRTVILVTNALQYLKSPHLDKIFVMQGGTVVESGSYHELVSRTDSQFKDFLEAFNSSMAGEYDDGASEDMEGSEGYDDSSPGTFERKVPSIRSSFPSPRHRRSSIKHTHDDDGSEKGDKLMTDEMAERAVGKVGLSVYMEWAKAAGGLWVGVPLLLIFSFEQGTTVLSNWWLTYWSHSATPDSKSQLHFLAIYGLINIGAIIAGFLPLMFTMYLGLKASKKLFSATLDTILSAPMSFFDTTPAGRIMNRFSKDMYTLDEELPPNFRMYLSCVFEVATTLVVVTSVTPIFAASLVPILYFYRVQQAYFSQCYRELKRIDSITRSPIYALFGETLDGPCTIRAFSAEIPLFERMTRLVDRQQHAYFLTQAGLCWLAVRLELIGTFIIFVACISAVYAKRGIDDGDTVFAGLAGLSISYALSVTQALNWGVRVGSDFEANMVAVERIKEYCSLKGEAPRKTDADKALGMAWPYKGVIEFRNSKLRYREGLPLVLKDLNITIPGQSKVGIVGRTGAGKSTLMTALMRLAELDSGQIIMDGVDIKTLGLQRLRSSIAVVPQDPVLFSGTVKTNLDPFDQYDNERLMDVLERVGLWSSESASAVSSLEDRVLQDGSNFSVGQRQLLVIARALLHGAGVVICDEATAAVDAEADARIQRILRTDFARATTLTVAHRLNTIMDSTHILVMDDGRAAEFDTPSNLLAKGGLFKDLVDKWEEEHDS